jgi:hypothetical protein
MARPPSVLRYGPPHQPADRDERVRDLSTMIADADSEEEDVSDD